MTATRRKIRNQTVLPFGDEQPITPPAPASEPYGPPMPVLRFQIPYQWDHHYTIPLIAILDVYDDNDDGACALKVAGCAEPIYVWIACETVCQAMPWLPMAKRRAAEKARREAARHG